MYSTWLDLSSNMDLSLEVNNVVFPFLESFPLFYAHVTLMRGQQKDNRAYRSNL
jgi:hypothetical protein